MSIDLLTVRELSVPGQNSKSGSGLINDNTKNKPEQSSNLGKVATGLGLATAVGAGVALKDGVNEGFKTIGGFGKSISSIFAIPATLLIPFTTAYGEYEGYKVKNPTEQSSRRLIETVYPILSLAFAPMTAFEPLEKAAQSKVHMATTMVNMPHIIFTFFSYTGGRFLTLLKSLKLTFVNLSDEEKNRVKNESKLVSTLGDIGSDNAAVTPEAHQAATGWINWFDMFTGNFSAVKERIAEAPVTNILGTFVGSVFWIPTFIGKSFDTVIRTLETTDQLKSALTEDSGLYKYAQRGKTWWHTTSASNSILGGILSGGREFGKIMQAIASPMGMVSVVFPAFDHFIHGFGNEEAQERGGIIAKVDKGLNIAAFAGHLYFTTLYGVFVRLPQTITTASFYACNTLNRMRGVLDKPNDSKYIDPRTIRDKIFNPNKGWAKWISDKARGFIERNTGKECLYDNIYKVIADEECFRLEREELYEKELKRHCEYTYVDSSTGETVTKVKEEHKDPPVEVWGKILERERKSIIERSEERFRKYLKEASGFDESKVNDFFDKYKIYDKIKVELEKLIDGEIDACLNRTKSQINQSDEKSKFEKPKMQSKDFMDMILHPVKYKNDLKEVFKFRTALSQLVVSPLNVLDFVNMVELGDKNLPYFLSNWLVQESSIRIGDYKAGNIGELMTVYCHAVQTAGKGLGKIAQASEVIFGSKA